jgi:hypothetical protein
MTTIGAVSDGDGLVALLDPAIAVGDGASILPDQRIAFGNPESLTLLGALAARTPLEMSVFPTFLLGATLVRLVLNISTTRLILSRAALDGPAAAGEVVEAFRVLTAMGRL